jgi:hypothetical protein
MTAVDAFESERMFLIATDHHTGLGRPYESWVPGWEVGLILSPTFHPAQGSLDALSMGMFRHTTTGEQSKWYVKAGPFTRAELEEGYATGSLNGEPFPNWSRLKTEGVAA